MNAPATKTVPADPRPARGGYLLHAWLLMALATLLCAAIEWDYILATHFAFLRVDGLAGGMAGCIGAAACLGGAMHFLDLALPGTRWFWRVLLLSQKRLLMIAQLLVMAMCVLAAGLMVFHKDIPGSEPWVTNPAYFSVNARG